MLSHFHFRYNHLSKSLIAPYAIAFVSLFAVLVLRFLAHPLLGNHSQYTVFLLAVLVTARFSGRSPALVVLLLGAFLGHLFFAEPYSALKWPTVSDLLAIFFYLIIGAFIIYLFDELKGRERQLKIQIDKQTQAENALRISEDRFRLASEALHGLIYEWDAVTGVSHRSSGLFEIVGYHPNEVPDSRIWWQDQMHPEDLARVLEIFAVTVANHIPWRSFEYRVRHKDGHYVWVWDNCGYFYDDAGQLTRLIGCTVSIHERKALAEALTRSEERFRLAAEALHGLIYDIDLVTQETYRSPGLFELIGYQPDEVPHSRAWWQKHIHPQDWERIQETFNNTVAQRRPTASDEYRILHKDGHYLWVWDSYRIIYDAAGRPVRMVGTTISIDERKTLAASLIQSEERFRVAFESANDAMSLSDAQGMIVTANEAYVRLYGYSLEEVIGQKFSIIFPEEARQQADEQYQQVFNQEMDSLAYEAVVQRKDGTIRTVESRVGFIAPYGQRLYMLSIVRDLTERKQAEVSLGARFDLTSSLAQAVTIEDVGRITVNYLQDRLGAKDGNIFIYYPQENMLEMLYTSSTAPPERIAPWRRFPADASYPATDVVKYNQSLWFSTPEERDAAYPSTKQASHFVEGASVILPLVAGAKVVGMIALTFSESRNFTEDERRFISSLIFQCAQALDRARLAQEAKDLAIIGERQRLSRELHDSVNQMLFSASVITELLPRMWQRQPEKALQQTELLHPLITGAMAEMRVLLWELRPESIIHAEITDLLIQILRSAQARQELAISLKEQGDKRLTLTEEVKLVFYRIAQESVHNVLKHGHATAIAIWLRRTSQCIALIIIDNGQGFDSTARGAGIGLNSMQERAASIGATFDVKSRIGKGTRVRLFWPTQEQT